jgi:hypothetical protein
MNAALIPAILAGLLIAPSAQGAPKAVAPLRFGYVWPANQQARYQIKADVKLAAAGDTDPITATAILVYRVNPKPAKSVGATPLEIAYETLDIELFGQPVVVPDEQARKALNKRITLSRTGEVHRTDSPGSGGLNLYVPGVDPGSLYALLFPVVFPERGVQPGDAWTYRNPLLGTARPPVSFVAEFVGPAPATDGGARRRLVEVHARFGMDVDISLNRDGKPVAEGEQVIVTRKGRIDGTGRYLFDTARGRFDHGSVTLKADMNETHVTAQPDAPPETISNRVDATIGLKLLPEKPAASTASRVK